MAAHTPENADPEKQKRDRCLQKWSQERCNNPWFLVLRYDELAEGEEVTVVAYPDIDERDRQGRFTEPRYSKGYEIPLAVVHERLTRADAGKLKSTLTLINKTQGIPFGQGLAFLAHLFFFIVDWDRFKAGEKSLLEGVTWGDLPEDIDKNLFMNEILAHPLTSVSKLLDLWSRIQGTVVSGIVVPAGDKLGQPNYLTLPPRWFDLDDLKRLDEQPDGLPQVPVLVSSALAPQMPKVLAFVGLTKQLEEQGVCSAERPGSRFPNVFRNDLDYWTVRYDGKECQLRHTKGLSYIAFLLQHRGQEYYALQLVHEVEDATPEPDELLSSMSEEQLSELGLSVRGATAAEEIMDAPYEADVRRHLKELEETRDIAEARGDTQAVSKAEDEIRQYRRVLAEGMGLGGRHRAVGNPAEKARVAVTQAIGRVLKKLRKEHHSLHEHLNSSLQTGAKCSYNPTTPIDWKF